MRNLLTLIFLFIITITIGQVPQGFNYQAVVRGSDGEIIKDQDVSVRISILQGTATSSSIYTETHSVQSNTFGLVNLIIGQGQSSNNFTTIDWSKTPYFVKIEFDPNGSSSYTELGTTQLLSVPYAMYAGNTGNSDDADADPTNELQVLSISNDTIYLSESNYVKLPVASVPQQMSVSEFGDTLYLSNGNHLIIPGASINNYNYTKYGVCSDNYYGEQVIITNNSDLIFAISNSADDYVFTKIDTLGQEIWTKSFDIDTINNSFPNEIIETNDGGFITLYNTYFSMPHAVLVKCNFAGDTLWTRAIDSNGQMECSDIFQTADNNYLVGGRKSGYSMLAKLDESGDTIWTKTYESNGSIFGIFETSNNNYLFGIGGTNCILYKTNSNGDTLWTKTFEGEIYITSISETADNKYLIALENGSNVIVNKLDTDKSIIWTKEYIEFQEGQLKNAFNLNNGDVLFAGRLDTSYGPVIENSHGGREVWLLRINPSGDIINSDVYGGRSSENFVESFTLVNNRILIISHTESNDGNVPSINITNDEGEGLWIFTIDI